MSESECFVFDPLIYFVGAADAVEDGVVLWGTRRSVLEGSNGGNGTSLVLAKERTRRKDPRHDLQYYTGGWNISNDHYIAVSLSWAFCSDSSKFSYKLRCFILLELNVVRILGSQLFLRLKFYYQHCFSLLFLPG